MLSSPHIPQPLVWPNKESGLFPCGVSSSPSTEIIYKRTVFTTHFQRTRRGTMVVVLLPPKPSIALTLGGPQHFDSCMWVQRALLSVPSPRHCPGCCATEMATIRSLSSKLPIRPSALTLSHRPRETVALEHTARLPGQWQAFVNACKPSTWRQAGMFPFPALGLSTGGGESRGPSSRLAQGDPEAFYLWPFLPTFF